MANIRSKLKEEATALYDSNGDYRTFNEIYAGKEDLFEGNIDDIIDPKMRKLFESIYEEPQKQQLKEGKKPESKKPVNKTDKFFEAIYKASNKIKEGDESPTSRETMAKYNFTGDEPGPKPDGVPNGHNRAGMGGSDSQTTQSGQDYSTNSKFFEAIYKVSNSKLKEADDWDDMEDDDFDWEKSDYDWDDLEDDDDWDPSRDPGVDFIKDKYGLEVEPDTDLEITRDMAGLDGDEVCTRCGAPLTVEDTYFSENDPTGCEPLCYDCAGEVDGITD